MMKKQRPRIALSAAAVHELAHAVIAVHLMMPVVCASIRRRRVRSERVQVTERNDSAI